MNDLIDYS